MKKCGGAGGGEIQKRRRAAREERPPILTPKNKCCWLPVRALLGTGSTVAVPAVFGSIVKEEGDFS